MASKEIWRPVVGYADYMVSDLGSVKSLDRVVKHMGGDKRIRGCILKPVNVGGYNHVSIGLGGSSASRKLIGIHRLAAEAFNLPKEDWHDRVDHKDGNPRNNKIGNLQWTDSVGNSRKGKRAKPIIQLDLQTGEFIKRWGSKGEACEALGLNNPSVGEAARGILNKKSAGGFKWVYEENYNGEV